MKIVSVIKLKLALHDIIGEDYTGRNLEWGIVR